MDYIADFLMVAISMVSFRKIPSEVTGKPRKGSLSMQTLIFRFLKDESGPSAIEYGLIAALISVVCIVAMTAVGTNLNVVYTTISTALAGA
jgi:pilus assembly protein Flp/PilA